MSDRQRIAEDLLGCAILPGGFAPCPGRARHTKGSGLRDFRVHLDAGVPTGFCFHSSCAVEVEEFNRELRKRIWLAENGGSETWSVWGSGVAPEPRVQSGKKDWGVDRERVKDFTRGVPEIDAEYLRRRSPVDVGGVSPLEFLRVLYREGERVLIFLDQRSQGEFVAWHRGAAMDSYRLSQTQGVKATRSPLPKGGDEGVWFLTNPVSAQWAINPNSTKGGGEAKWSRRCEATVTAWRFFVLESDELEAGEWLRVVSALRLPIAALYTSGGRSIHALVRCEVPSKAHWDEVRNALRPLVCPLGADPAALSAVRLSRLPGCLRGKRMQELLWLAEEPTEWPLWLQPVRRS